MFPPRYFPTRYFAPRYWPTGGSPAVSTTIDWNCSNQVKLTLNNSTTLVLNNPEPGEHYFIEIIQDAIGSRTISWPSDVKWPGGTAPTLSTAANAIDVVTMVRDNDSRYLAEFTLNFS